MSLPIKGVAYDYPILLVDISDPSKYVVNPTVVLGDFKISIDYGAFANLSTTPVVTPSGSSQVKIDLSASEMNGEKIMILGVDQSADEWRDIGIIIDVPKGSVETLVSGVIRANEAGSFPIQLADHDGNPVPLSAVSVFVSIDGGTFNSAVGTATVTDIDGWTYVSYAAADVNGTESVTFKLVASGAKNRFQPFLLSV